jgi:pyrophosphate--fructose-6-phosphate 1-phosphotransferase
MKSSLQNLRLKYIPKIPTSLENFEYLAPVARDRISLDSQVAGYFPHLQDPQVFNFRQADKQSLKHLKVGIVFSGGPAAGGHNVIAGVFDALRKCDKKTTLIGFLNGPLGVINNQFRILDETLINQVRNQGGFELLGSGRTKIETEQQFAKSLTTCVSHQLDGLVIVGGDDSNTNAAFLAEYFAQKKVSTSVVGVPKTIDGDLKNSWIETSFGFDSASKTYSEIIGNLLNDAASQNKYYFFVKVMGRSASYLVLECALKTHPQLALISEEIAAEQHSLERIVNQITDLIIERAQLGKQHGVILIPEGLIEFIPEIKKLITELNTLFAKLGSVKLSDISAEGIKTLQTFPKEIQAQLLLERDPHGNVPVSQIETEKMLITLVKEELKKRKNSAVNFSSQPLFCGYEGRCCLPSNFDANYCYALGLTATLLIQNALTGYMAVIERLNQPVEQWEATAVPLVGMIALEERKGSLKPVIKKGLVDLQEHSFQNFKAQRGAWRVKDEFLVPGPIQFFGPQDLTDTCPLILT